MKLYGHLVDIHNRDIYPAEICIEKTTIKSIVKVNKAPEVFILPGLIDAHIHIESSMVTPGAFALTAVKHGTIGVVSDPHEIANVLGKKGVRFMIKDAGTVPLKFWFGAPSCVPATIFETSGASLSHVEIEELLTQTDIKYLSEMMNFPGVIFDDEEVIKKLKIAQKLNKPIDGHAPGLTGKDLRKYIAGGISTDHECSTIEEAKEKLSLGMKILIREGSAARNMSALKELFNTDPDNVMICSDDLHPEMLKERHINKLVAELIGEGFNKFDVIRSATFNPVKHYNLEAGLLRQGDIADIIIVDDLKKMNVLETWIDGQKIFEKGKVLFDYSPGPGINNFNCREIFEKQIKLVNRRQSVRLIQASEGELLTKGIIWNPGKSEFLEPDISADVLKIVVKDRYKDLLPAVGFINGFGLKRGAFASSVAHDSHNIIAIGTCDRDIVNSINEIIRIKGGLSVSFDNQIDSIQLDIAGIMTTRSCENVASDYKRLNDLVVSLGSTMTAPFMTMSFMALLVIPDLKIGDKGLFDVTKFEIVSLYLEKD